MQKEATAACPLSRQKCSMVAKLAQKPNKGRSLRLLQFDWISKSKGIRIHLAMAPTAIQILNRQTQSRQEYSKLGKNTGNHGVHTNKRESNANINFQK